MGKGLQENQEHGEPRLTAMKPPRWMPLSGTVRDHARTLGLTLTDIGVLTSIRTLQEVEEYTRFHLSQITALCPLDLPDTVACSIAHMQQVGLLLVTVYEDGSSSYDFGPLFQQCVELISGQAPKQGQPLLAAYQEAGQPFGPTLAGFCIWCVQRRQQEQVRAGTGHPSPVSHAGSVSLMLRRVPSPCSSA